LRRPLPTDVVSRHLLKSQMSNTITTDIPSRGSSPLEYHQHVGCTSCRERFLIVGLTKH